MSLYHLWSLHPFDKSRWGTQGWVDVDIIDIVDVATDKLDKTIDKFRCNLDNNQPSFNNNLNQRDTSVTP
jgi:hypothetical protein